MRIWFALTMLVCCLGSVLPLHAQTVVGTWQVDQDGQKGVMKITKGANGNLHGEIYRLGDELSGPLNGNPISTIAVKGRQVHLDPDEDEATFDGQVSVDGKTLAGRWLSRGQTYPVTFHRATTKTAWPIDPSPHKVLLVPVDKTVRLEVLDWGGNGPPLIFVAGLGNTAHVFDDFAPLFTSRRHVYGITRRGFGLSSRPEPAPENYDADRMGDDVLAVIDALKLNRPVLVGHSMGGEELSSIGTRHPEKVSGLIYLDASYAYAFYNPQGAINTNVDFSVMRRDMLEMTLASPSKAKALIQDMQAMLPLLQNDLQTLGQQQQGQPDPPQPTPPKLRDQILESIVSGERRYAAVKPPVLAIVATPHACASNCNTPQYKAGEADVVAQADAFEAGTPQARVVRIPGANHYVFRSNEAQVVREMNAFLDGLR